MNVDTSNCFVPMLRSRDVTVHGIVFVSDIDVKTQEDPTSMHVFSWQGPSPSRSSNFVVVDREMFDSDSTRVLKPGS